MDRLFSPIITIFCIYGMYAAFRDSGFDKVLDQKAPGWRNNAIVRQVQKDFGNQVSSPTPSPTPSPEMGAKIRANINTPWGSGDYKLQFKTNDK